MNFVMNIIDSCRILFEVKNIFENRIFFRNLTKIVCHFSYLKTEKLANFYFLGSFELFSYLTFFTFKQLQLSHFSFVINKFGKH